ncbi:MAG: FxsA family protein [Deltaproteobacteria bacterium]|nr:FxsA family protein [Deltaproteobacteria bacterium]
MGRLLLLFILVPAVELALLIELGKMIGTPGTLGIIVLTGAVGASLARRQGLRVLRDLQAETTAGRLPAEPLMDGAIILLAGALLITPGILTDVFGFLCLVPATRALVKRAARRRFERAMREGSVVVMGGFDGSPMPGSEGHIVDVTPEPHPQSESRDHRLR